MQTARDLADRVVAFRQEAWEEADPAVAVATSRQLNPEDATVVNRFVADAGFDGDAGLEMARRVKSLLVGQVEARVDNAPCDCG
ncbi:MAG: hypothetical protein U0791_05195 [Gemmataceae bacterium]